MLPPIHSDNKFMNERPVVKMATVFNRVSTLIDPNLDVVLDTQNVINNEIATGNSNRETLAKAYGRKNNKIQGR